MKNELPRNPLRVGLRKLDLHLKAAADLKLAAVFDA